jgi:hypothetical protein
MGKDNLKSMMPMPDDWVIEDEMTYRSPKALRMAGLRLETSRGS